MLFGCVCVCVRVCMCMHMGATHSKCWWKYAFSCFSDEKCNKENKKTENEAKKKPVFWLAPKRCMQVLLPEKKTFS